MPTSEEETSLYQQAAEGVSLEVDNETIRARPPLPRCNRCGGLARPNVLMFGDWDWLPHRTEAQEQRSWKWRAEIEGSRLAVIELGAGLAVPTVRYTTNIKHCESFRKDSGRIGVTPCPSDD